jgi:hypothetical protein
MKSRMTTSADRARGRRLSRFADGAAENHAQESRTFSSGELRRFAGSTTPYRQDHLSTSLPHPRR